MPFCTNCGQQLAEDARFCPNCGKAAAVSDDNSKRKQEYVGKVLKCPACGAMLPSFTAVCPSCGYEINSAGVSDSLSAFIAQIEECDRRIAAGPRRPAVRKGGWATWSLLQKGGWILLNFYTMCIPLLIYWLMPRMKPVAEPTLAAEEAHKAAVIDNYQFSNDRGAILDGMLFVKSKISFLASGPVNANDLYWLRLWRKKADELYSKAEVLIPDDPIVEDAYNDILLDQIRAEQTQRKNVWRTRGIVIAVIVLICLISVASTEAAIL